MPFIKLQKSKIISYIFSALLGILYTQKMILSTWSLLFFNMDFKAQGKRLKMLIYMNHKEKINTNQVILDLNAIKKFRKTYTRAKVKTS